MYELISKYSYAYVHEEMIMTRIWWYYFRGIISVLVSCDCNELERLSVESCLSLGLRSASNYAWSAATSRCHFKAYTNA